MLRPAASQALLDSHGRGDADLEMRVLKAKSFAGQQIHVRSSIGHLAAKYTNRVATHVVDGDEENVGLFCL